MYVPHYVVKREVLTKKAVNFSEMSAMTNDEITL